MDINDIRNSRLPTRIEKPVFNDFSKSARHRSLINNQTFMDNRRTKTSLSEKDLICNDFREDSFNLFYQKQIPVKKPNQKSEKPLIPCVVVRRKPEDKQRNPDRITLDRQNLTSCPILENEDNIRLLNYQYNYINQIQHLDKLRKLILLDLYDNRIEKISGLETLKSLRVLMLGRNRISKIEGLESLTRLDVLDLHANRIQTIENISHLSDLRVLNLAGNNIECLSNLKGLYSLSEINVRRNCIESVIDVDSTNCPNLQRIFLSFNNIGKISDFACLIDLSSLNELSIDNNPFCSHNNFRSAVIFNFTQLEQLDSKPITEDDRNKAKQVINRLELGSKSNSGLSRHIHQINNSRTSNNDQHSNNIQRFHSMKERRKGSIYNPQRIFESWNQNGKNVSPRLSIKCFSSASNSLYVTDSQNNISTINDADQEMLSRNNRLNKSMQDFNSSINKEFMAIEETISKPLQNNTQSQTQLQNSESYLSSKKQVATRPTSSSSSLLKVETSNSTILTLKNTPDNNDIIPTTNRRNNSNEIKPVNKNTIEIVNDNDQIQFYSSLALKVFDDKEFWSSKPGLSASITTLTFQKIDFNEIEKIFFQIKTRFPNIKKIVYQECNIRCYSQINSMANLKRLEELIIDNSDNPISSFKLIRSYVIFRLAHLGLKKFNDEEINDQEYLTARRYFFNLAMIGPNQILQLHLIGIINDLRKRELFHSSGNEQMIPMSIHNPNFSQTPSVNLDLVGKSGLLSSVPSESDCLSENKSRDLSIVVMKTVFDNVEKQRDWEDRFHNQWELGLWQIVLNRLIPILSNRHEYMKQQFDRILYKSNNLKPNTSIPNKK